MNQHTSLDERLAAAKYFAECMEFHGQILVDSMENECTTSYAAFPIRLCVIFNGQVHYIGGFGPTFYEPNEVGEWIKRWKEKTPFKEFEEHESNQDDLSVGNSITASQSKNTFNKKQKNVYKNNKNSSRKVRSDYKTEDKKVTLCTSHLDMTKIPRQP